MKLEELTIKKIRKGIKKKIFSAQDLTEKYFKKIKKEDKKISSYLLLTKDLALKQAKKIDQKINKGDKIGKLAGVSLAIKDNMLVEGEKCTAGSKILENYKASYSATCIKKLIKEDAIILGKTNLDEFAMGSSTENSAFQVTKNPHDKERVPGGSSGGSAAATAASLCHASLGSDTGGSIRQPAAFCGVVGLKPTYGLVSRFGLIAYGSSLDQIGPISRSVADAAAVLDVIAGHDPRDSTSVNRTKINYLDSIKNGKDIPGLRIGIPREYWGEGLDDEVRQSCRQAIDALKETGAREVDISLPLTDYAIATYYILAMAEASSNLARFDGVRFGYRDKDALELKEMYTRSRTKGFGEEVQ